MSKGLAVGFVEEGYETLEFHYPRLRLQEAGYHVEVVSPEKGKTYKAKDGAYPAKVCRSREGCHMRRLGLSAVILFPYFLLTAQSTASSADIKPSDVKIVVVPGGHCPQGLQKCPKCVELLRACYNV